MHTYRRVMLIHQDIECEMTIRMDHHTEDPSRTNHVNVFGMWKEFAQECGFDYNKMLRFKYLHTLEGDHGEEDSMPVFHVC